MTSTFSKGVVATSVRNILHFADVHMEANAVSTESTIKGIWHIINEVPPETLNAIIISGDMFDKAMVVPASKLALVLSFAGKLIDYCVREGVVLRILEGTPSHDRGQSEIFVDVAKLKGYPEYVSYHPDLELVTDPVTGLTTLYVPDELNHDNEVTLKQAKALLRKHGLEKADYIIMHGSFKYQVGLILTRPHHLEQPWIDLCNFFIVCGHVHGHSVYGKKILIPGSTNRTAHNEEKVKGAILTTVDLETMASDWKFIENPHATVFETIDVRGQTCRDIVKLLLGLDRPDRSNIRLLVNRADESLKSFAALKTVRPDYRLTRKVADEKKAEDEPKVIFDKATKGISVTYNNVSKLLSSHISDTKGFTTDELTGLLHTHVEKCRNGIRSR